MFRIEVNAMNGKQKQIPLTDAEIADANTRTEAEKVKRDASYLDQLKRDAMQEELEALVNVDTGKTPKAQKFQVEKAKQGK